MSHPNPLYPEGYLSVEFHEPTCEKLKKSTGAIWKGPIHQNWVLVDDQGKVLGTLRTLGVRMPKKDRRYSLQITGCLFIDTFLFLERTLNLV